MRTIRKPFPLLFSLCTAVSLLFSASASAGENSSLQNGDVIVDINFDDGGTDGFTIYTNGGSCEISNEDGALAVDITNCGNLDYANQVYWDGFQLVQGCEYTYSFDIACDISRQVEYRLQLNGGDYHAYHGSWMQAGPSMTHVEESFTMTEDTDPAPRIAFNMGYTTDMDSDPGPHRVLIDNIVLTVKDASGSAAAEDTSESSPLAALSQVGYLPDQSKTVVIEECGNDASFSVIDAQTGEVVYEGSFDAPMYDKAVGADLRQGDFSDFTLPGTYLIHVENGDLSANSHPFTIGDDVYDDLFGSTVRMLSLQRCGTEVDSGAAAGGFSHDPCHTGQALVYGTDRMMDVSGGWHDAGDYGRYVVSGAKAVADLMIAWAYFGADMDDLGIPESGNGIPDVLDEARYELDWMLKMQDEETGGVWHKVTTYSFPGVIMPDEDTEQLVVSPISTAATGDFAAVMARASVIYKDFDPDFSQAALEVAKKAWAYIQDAEDSTGFVNPPEISTGEYPDGTTHDERFWAAAELYLAGEEDMADSVSRLMEEHDQTPGLGWASVGSYAMYDLLLSQPADTADGDAKEAAGLQPGPSSDLPAELTAAVREALLSEADEILARSEEDGFHMALGENYPWGSNMTVANNGIALLLASRITGDEKYGRLADEHLSYLLGENATGYCYVTDFGAVSPEDPHHRPSQYLGAAIPGMLVGGPDSNLEDPYAQSVLSDEAPALCYVDSDQSYSCNEVAVYWNSPLVCLLAFFQ